jgi:hypothetical protein
MNRADQPLSLTIVAKRAARALDATRQGRIRPNRRARRSPEIVGGDALKRVVVDRRRRPFMRKRVNGPSS